MTINLQQEELNIMQREQDIMKQEEERQQHDLQEVIKTNEELDVALQNKDEEISCHIQKEEIYNTKIKELQNQVKIFKEMENEYEITQEEHRQEIEDLKNALNSQNHNENILYKDLEKARNEIEKLKQEINQNTQENIQAETSAIMESNQLESTNEEIIEHDSLTWCHSPQSFLYGLESEKCHSTPTKPETTNQQNLGKDNSNTTKLSTAEDNSNIHYENSNVLTGLENTRNELQEQVANAQKSNQDKMEMLLRERTELKKPAKYEDFDLKTKHKERILKIIIDKSKFQK